MDSSELPDLNERVARLREQRKLAATTAAPATPAQVATAKQDADPTDRTSRARIVLAVDYGTTFTGLWFLGELSVPPQL